MIYRLIAPSWLTNVKKVHEGVFTQDEIIEFNSQGYNVYYFPNYPSLYEGGNVSGSQVDTFKWLFVDFDLKSQHYPTKDAFLSRLSEFVLLPTKVIDSGNGIHAYWKVSNLDAMAYLKLQRRLMRHLNTDDAVCSIAQLMRVENTFNTKDPDNFKLTKILFQEDIEYDCEQLNQALLPLTEHDEKACLDHFNKTFNPEKLQQVDDHIPLKFAQLLKNNKEAQEIWSGNRDDRSVSDFRLGHIMLASGLTKEEATSVLVNSAKALGRSEHHRISYATNIVDKIWSFEQKAEFAYLSSSVKDILQKANNDLMGTRFNCWPYLDNTVSGFRLGQVLGLVAGVGVGKTAVAINMFLGFVQSNPDYIHFFVSLEQPRKEIAERWRRICGSNEWLHSKVHILDNYDDNGAYRNLSLDDIQNYIIGFQTQTNQKVGCVVIDHIGVLKKASKEGRQSIEDICHKMKAFSIATNTLLIMQSQAPREKAGVGDLELNKDAAYGTVFFESYCDYLITMHQPLKRCYAEGAPTITAFKFCKIRHKQAEDVIKEDICYKVMFDQKTGRLRELTQDEEKSFSFFLTKATNKRKNDHKTELVNYTSIAPDSAGPNG